MENKKLTAGEIMEKIMEDGLYPNLKRLQKEDELIKKTIRTHLKDSENPRHEFKKQSIVCKFVTKRISKIDYESLNEYLFNLGLLLPIVELDHKQIKKNLFLYEQLEPFQLPNGHYLKPNFNKLGKSLNSVDDINLDHLKVQDLAQSYVLLQPKLRKYEELYEQAKKQMMRCSILKREKKLSHKYGSVSLIDKDPLYDTQKIHQEMGEEILIKYGKPNPKKLQEFILKGFINESEIDQFKTIVDLRLDFVVMTLEAEQRSLDMLNKRRMIASQNYVRSLI